MNKSKTNYVIVVYYNNEEYLEDCYLLGWNCRDDYYSTDYCGDDIITPKNNIKKNENDLIWVSTNTSVYAGETIEDCLEQAECGNREGLKCMICKLEKDEDENWKVIPVITK